MKSFERLNQSLASEVPADDLEPFALGLRRLASARARRFSAGAITRETGLSRDRARQLLMRAISEGLLRPVYEVECPVCGTLVTTTDGPGDLQESLVCKNPSSPHRFPRNEGVVLVFFDFLPDVLEEVEQDPG